MKKVFAYSAIVLLLAAAMACNKTDSVLSGENNIRFAIATPTTRALVENVSDLQEMQTLQVFDLLDGANYFAENETVSYDEGLWKFDSGKGYTWKTGTHTFFAFTEGAGTVNLTDTTLAVSKKLTTASEDLVYSNVVAKTAEQAAADNYKAVSLNMDHLFAAIAINVVNCTSSDVVVNSVSKPSISNQGSATVNFGLDTTTVTYGAVSGGSDFVAATTTVADATLASTGMIDVLGQAAADAPVYYVVWPQEIDADDVQITVNYTVTTAEGTDGKEATISLPASVWQAGNKYRYNLNIYPTQIMLTFVVEPWDVVNVGAIDTSTGSINMSNVTWQNSKVFVNDTLKNTLVNSDYAIYMFKNAYKAVASKYAENVYLTYEEDVYQTYEEDVYGEDGTTIIHHQGDPVLDDDNNPIIIHHQGDQVLDEDENPILLHKAGDPVLDENGEQVYVKGDASSYTYFPAQGFFTVNYPKSGLFKITLIQASYWNNPVPEGVYEIWIYDSTLATPGFRKMEDAGEEITNETVYFQIRAAAGVSAPHDEYRAQIDILFKPADSTGSTENSEWISAYSEVRANYACVIKAETTN